MGDNMEDYDVFNEMQNIKDKSLFWINITKVLKINKN